MGSDWKFGWRAPSHRLFIANLLKKYLGPEQGSGLDCNKSYSKLKLPFKLNELFQQDDEIKEQNFNRDINSLKFPLIKIHKV